MEHIYDTVIIGGGPGGYTAALYCARAGLDTLLLEKLGPGGQMALTAHIDNYPGFPDGIDGNALAEHMRQGAERFGGKTVLAEALSVSLTGRHKFTESSEGVFGSRTLILATGADPRPLNVPGEQALARRGVSYCAQCDGMFYKGKTVAVIGGGNTAAADALLLSRICKKVILVHRRDRLRAASVYYEALKKAENVEFRWNSTVTALLGQERLTGMQLRTKDAQMQLSCDGVFVCIGREPVTALVRDKLDLDPAGYIRADESTRTSLPGVFAVGDVRTKPLRQIVTATADGAVACHHVEEYLAETQTR